MPFGAKIKYERINDSEEKNKESEALTDLLIKHGYHPIPTHVSERISAIGPLRLKAALDRCIWRNPLRLYAADNHRWSFFRARKIGQLTPEIRLHSIFEDANFEATTCTLLLAHANNRDTSTFVR